MRYPTFAWLLDRFPIFESVAFAQWSKDEIDRMLTWAVGPDWRSVTCDYVPDRLMTRIGMDVSVESDLMQTLVAIREEYTQYQLDEAVKQAQAQIN